LEDVESCAILSELRIYISRGGRILGGDRTQSVANPAKILPAIRHLYDAAIDAEKWPVFLKELAAAFEAKSS